MSLASNVTGDLAAHAAHRHKAMIPLNGRPAVSYLLQNLRNCGSVSRVILVSDEPGIECASEADVCIDAGGDMSECVLAGVKAAENSERCLIMNGDMPLASCEALTDLLRGAPDCDVVYPIVGKSDVSGAFPGRSAFYVNSREGQFTGASCLLFSPEAVLPKRDMLIRLLNARSNPKELLAIVGPGFAMKMMLTKLPLGEFETHLSQALGLSCRVFTTHFPELLVSIDKLSDIEMMERRLAAASS